jgi:aryl-alcohol dehydrogenase-like predicted oxidoreductase
VSRLGLGLAALGRPAYLNVAHAVDVGPAAATPAQLEAHAHRVLDAAWSLGIRYIDAARSYGQAEAFLASWLDRTGHQVEIGSKWGYTYTGDWQVGPDVVHEVKDHSARALRRQYSETRDLLGDRLDLYQIHSATLQSGVLDDREVLDELVRIRDEDAISIGLSVSGPGQAATIRRALEIPVFASVQATWNLLEPSAAPALADASSAGWRVIVKEPLANGRLAAQADLAIATALAQPWADIVLSGAATVAQLEQNVKAANNAATAPVDTIATAEDPEAYWAYRSTLPWT